MNKDLQEWVAHQALGQRNLLPVLIKGFGPLVPNHEKLNEVLRMMIEIHPIKISGFRRAWSYDATQNTITPDRLGTPNVVYGERVARPIESFHFMWMNDLLRKATTAAREDAKITVLYILPDFTHQVVEEAYLCEEMYPRHLAAPAARRDLTVDGEPAKTEVLYFSQTSQKKSIDAFAKEVLKTIVNSTHPDCTTNPTDEIKRLTTVYGDAFK